MTKKLILLLLALPLLLMIILFTATDTVSRAIDVPVSSIDILGDEIVYLDLDKQETYKIDYAVYPTTAKNQSVVFSTQPVGGNPLAELSYEEGYLIPKSVGSAKVYLTTVDGGFKDSFIVEVDATGLESIECTVDNDKLVVGDKATIDTKLYPANASDTLLVYESDNEKVAKVSASGVITAVGKGTATITVSSETYPDIKDTVTVTVGNKDAMDLGASEITSWGASGKVPISIDVKGTYTLEYEALDKNGNPIADDVLSAEFDYSGYLDGLVSLNYTFMKEDFFDEVVINITMSSSLGDITKSCTVSRTKSISAKFENEGAFGLAAGQTANIPFTVIPDDAEFTCTATASNDNITVKTVGTRIIVIGHKIGVTTVELTVTGKDPELGSKKITVDVAIRPKSVAITENAATYGIEDVLTIGKYGADNALSSFYLHYSMPGIAGEGFSESFKWYSSSDEVDIGKDGLIIFKNDTFSGIVDFRAGFSYGGVEMLSEKMSIRCIADGINVSSYAELLTATKSGKPTILQASIKDDFGYVNGEPVYTEIETTYDKTYYENAGSSSESTKIKVLLEIKNDLYGNGYMINAHNLAYGLDETGQLKHTALFRGPKNFVAMSEGEGSAISVKAQDNICFAIYEGVTVSNVELRACDLTATGGSYDLTDLTYVGTTVEVLGDNVNIEYSRITNGRTVLRAFGDVSDPTKVITVNISNSVLSGAREFIMRIGSNCFVDGTTKDPSPLVPEDDGDDFNTKTFYNSLSEEEKAAYDAKFIKTFVNVKNSVFKDAGIFAIGIDSHFSGAALADGTQYEYILGTLISHWKDLAKTSYGAKLSFDGDVRMYNWKDLEEVDSSTLIEIVGKSNYESMKIDIYHMVTTASEKDAFKNIIYNDGDTKYVHAGITFFGGGKNYGVFDIGEYDANKFSVYEVSFEDMNRPELRAAAGNHSFYFYIHDSTTKDFLPPDQKEILNSDNAYDCIYK